MPNVLRTGRPEVYPEIPDEMLVAGSHDAEHLAVARALGLQVGDGRCRSSRARGTLGAITLVSAESGRRYGAAELSLAMRAGGAPALAVDNSLLYADAQRVVAAARRLPVDRRRTSCARR